MNGFSVCVLMATFNGQAYLLEQLESIIGQTVENIKILVSDDGSQDLTKSILVEHQARYPGTIEIVDGPRSGLERNFYSLIDRAKGFDLYAFADQDDIWEPARIEKAIERYQKVDGEIPFAYCSATLLVDENAVCIGLEKRPPVESIQLRHALGYCISTGNTIVFNEAARRIFPPSLNRIEPLGHDWLTFIYVLMFDGSVVYDPFPGVRYRIHSANQSGVRAGALGRLTLLRDWILRGKLKRTNRQIIDSTDLVLSNASTEIIRLLDEFKAVHRASIFVRICSFYRVNITRKDPSTNWINWMAVILGKF
ncbi:glycosyltransferase [Roseateles sp.]|uniref:glycosyltransferase n=1 Tax=Roseateles sp. TaxID=1971397 RepID=UPI003263D2AA